MVASFQCERCFKGEYRLKGTRAWLPLKGQSKLTFKDDTGAEKDFQISVVDTLEAYMNNECATTYKSERVDLSLYLNVSKTDSIAVLLGPPSSICLVAEANKESYMSTCRFFNTESSTAMMAFSNYKVGNRTYADVRLFQANEGNDKAIDSIVLAKDHGIVAFKYNNQNFTLKVD
jgi:hypothetical protein